MKVSNDAVVLSKGTAADEDSYSAFAAADSRGAGLKDLLRQRGIERIYVGGLATDYCVKETVLEGLIQGFQVVLLQDAIWASISNPKILLKPLTLWSKPGLRSHLLWTVFVLNEIVIALSNQCSVPIGLAGCPVPKTDLGSRWFSDS